MGRRYQKPGSDQCRKYICQARRTEPMILDNFKSTHSEPGLFLPWASASFQKPGVGRLVKFWWCQCWLGDRITILATSFWSSENAAGLFANSRSHRHLSIFVWSKRCRILCVDSKSVNKNWTFFDQVMAFFVKYDLMIFTILAEV